MKVEKEVKKQLKDERLRILKNRYFNLEMDRIGLLSAGDEAGAEEIARRIEKVKQAYEAIEAIDVNQ